MKKIKALFLASNPENSSQLRLDEEIRTISEKISGSEHRDSLEMISLWAVRPDDLIQSFNVHKPEIVHFSGHGSIEGEIMLMDKNRQDKSVSTESLRMLFTSMKDNIRLVVLNACFSKSQADTIKDIVDCVVGMDNEIGDDAAITFAASFYRGIGFNRSIKESFDQAKTSMALEGFSDIKTPKLIVRENIDPSSIFLLSSKSQIDSKAPKRLKELINSGSKFINIPFSDHLSNTHGSEDDYIYCELRMRQTEAIYVFCVNYRMRVVDAAEYLADEIFPHLKYEDYEWNFIIGNREIPANHTFESSGIKSDDTVYLLGNHRRPRIMPCRI